MLGVRDKGSSLSPETQIIRTCVINNKKNGKMGRGGRQGTAEPPRGTVTHFRVRAKDTPWKFMRSPFCCPYGRLLQLNDFRQKVCLHK